MRHLGIWMAMVLLAGCVSPQMMTRDYETYQKAELVPLGPEEDCDVFRYSVRDFTSYDPADPRQEKIRLDCLRAWLGQNDYDVTRMVIAERTILSAAVRVTAGGRYYDAYYIVRVPTKQ